jgi:hypothetical protein
MPLPDAPPTDESRVYREFASKVAMAGGSSSITPDLIDNFLNSLFLDEYAEDELRRLLLIGIAANAKSTSGPMPGTIDVVNFNATSSGSAVGVTESGFWQNPGEVWKIFAPSLSVGGGSGSIQHELRMIRDGSTLEILDFSSTGGSLRPTTEEGFIGGEIYVSYPAYLVYEATGTFTNSGLALGVARVR